MSPELVRPVGHRRRRWTQQVGAGLLLAITSATFTARAAGESNTARPESSNPLFFDGLRALETHQYAKAKQLFERLYQGSAAPEVLYQLGRVAQGEGKDVLAADLFRRYRELLGGQIDAASKSVIDSHLAALKQPVTEVRIVAPDGDFLSVDGQLIGRSPLNGTVWLTPGRHRFAIDRNGSRFESDVLNIPEGKTAQVNLSSGNRGAAVVVLSLPPAAMLAFTGSASLEVAALLLGHCYGKLCRVASAVDAYREAERTAAAQIANGKDASGTVKEVRGSALEHMADLEPRVPYHDRDKHRRKGYSLPAVWGSLILTYRVSQRRRSEMRADNSSRVRICRVGCIRTNDRPSTRQLG